MSADLRLVIFDVDGTLVDSQADILAAMTQAFERADLVPPSRNAILSIVGLSLDHAILRLVPDVPADVLGRMVDWYKEAYVGLRAKTGAAHSSPLYPGARETIGALSGDPGVLLGVATGKSRRGLDKLIEAHSLLDVFVTLQVSDHHPSKPHPSMIEACLAETGVLPKNAVMIGDTSFDIDMAQAAGVPAIGVTWGYHPRPALAHADVVVDRFADIRDALDLVWRQAG
ncbi:MAG: HAD-IA family hydrolase [Pseudomonadota bacterium]